MLAVLPPEIWDEIIDHLDYDYEPLAACVRVCRQWNPRARSLLNKWIAFCDMEDVRRVAKIARGNGSKGPRFIDLRGDRSDRQRPITHLAAFAMMFGGRWTRVQYLQIYCANWAMGAIRMDTFLDISIFTSITALRLVDVAFPTAVTFVHLVCSLQNLSSLYCSKLRFSAPHINPLVFPTRTRTITLRELYIFDCPLVDIIDFLLATKIGDHVEHIELSDLRQPSVIGESVAYRVNSLLKNLQLLRHLELSVDLSRNPTNPTESLADHHLFLGQSSKLEKLEIHYSISAKYSDYNWLADTLSRITCDSIHTIWLWADWRREYDTDSDEAMYNDIITDLDPESCAHLERVFALPVFAKLETVAFIPSYQDDTFRTAWKEALESRLPKLYGRGILRTSEW